MKKLKKDPSFKKLSVLQSNYCSLAVKRNQAKMNIICHKHGFCSNCPLCINDRKAETITAITAKHCLDIKVWPASLLTSYVHDEGLVKSIVSISKYNYPGAEGKWSQGISRRLSNGTPIGEGSKERIASQVFADILDYIRSQALEHAEERLGYRKSVGYSHRKIGGVTCITLDNSLPKGPFSEAFEALISERIPEAISKKRLADERLRKSKEEQKAEEERLMNIAAEKEARRRLAEAAKSKAFEAAVSAKMAELMSNTSTLEIRTTLREIELNGLF